MNNGIIAIGGLLALVGAKSRLGSGIRLSKGIYIDNTISIISIDELKDSEIIDVWDDEYDMYLPKHIIFDKFVNFFKKTALNFSDIGFSVEEIEPLPAFMESGIDKERFFRLKTMIPKAETIISVFFNGSYIDCRLFCYMSPQESPATSKNFSLFADVSESIFNFLNQTRLNTRGYIENEQMNLSRLRSEQLWNDILFILREQSYFYSEEGSYEVKILVHHAGSPYDIYKKPESTMPKLRKR